MQMRLPACLHRIGLFLLLGSFATTGFSQSIKGKVYDAKTGEPLIGASVTVEGQPAKTIVKLDGSFVLHLPAAGKYRVKITTIGYANPNKTEVTVNGSETAQVDIPMQATATALQEA